MHPAGWSSEPPSEEVRASIRSAWMRARGLRRRQSNHACESLIRRGRCSCGGGSALPGSDHVETFSAFGRVACAVLQPYQLSPESMRALADMEATGEVVVLVGGGPAWHYPGAVLHIEVWHRETKERVDAERRDAAMATIRAGAEARRA